MTKEEILEFINFNKKTEGEELFSIRKDCYLLIAKIIINFGFSNSLFKEPYLLLKDYLYLIQKEMAVYDYILIHLDKLDLDIISDLLEKIDILHEKAFNRLDKDLLDIETSIDLHDNTRIKRSKYNDLNTNFEECYTSLTSL